MVARLLSRPDEMLSRPDDFLSRPDDLVSRPDEMLSRPDEIKIIFQLGSSRLPYGPNLRKYVLNIMMTRYNVRLQTLLQSYLLSITDSQRLLLMIIRRR